MKCRSVAGLWPASPPSHLITAAATFEDPTAIFSGGSDGSIVHWTLLSPDDTDHLIRITPLAILCGHAAPVVSLSSCNPLPSSAAALLSACADGVLCVWSRSTGRCARRRSLPTWAGSPSLLSPVPSSPHQVCIACASPDSSTKWIVVIVDSSTLAIIRTVHHGSLATTPAKSMIVISPVHNKQQIGLIDSHGRSQVFNLDSSFNEEGTSDDRKSSSLDFERPFVEEDVLRETVYAVVLDTRADLVAIVFASRCEFKSFESGVKIGELSLEDTSLYEEDSNVYLAGGMFLECEGADDDKAEERDMDKEPGRYFVVWSANGGAILFEIFSSSGMIMFEPRCEIPFRPSTRGFANVLFRFCLLSRSLVRIESICYHVNGAALWRPHISIWSLEQSKLSNPSSSTMLGEGGFPNSFNGESSSTCSMEAIDIQVAKGAFDGLSGLLHTVSSSMVLSEDLFFPYALVYGFYSGEIEVVHFPYFIPEAQPIGNLRYPQVYKRFLSGHTSAIICLAAHRMQGNFEESSFHRVLISGSSDCTVCIWNLDSGTLLRAMHHHIATVRHIIFPPPGTYHPWNDCFLSSGDDGCVALVSLHTLRVERMFPGHPGYPSKIAWDGTKGYLACLFKNTSSGERINILYLWDVKTGARERVIRGTSSLSMFDHLHRGVNAISTTGGLFGRATSTSSLLCFPEDTDISGILMTKTPVPSEAQKSVANVTELNTYLSQNKEKGQVYSTEHDRCLQMSSENNHCPIISSCLFPGVASLRFDLSSLMTSHFVQSREVLKGFHYDAERPDMQGSSNERPDVQKIDSYDAEVPLEECLLKLALCFLHFWDVDHKLDKLLEEEMNVHKPEGFFLSPGLLGDNGSISLMFPDLHATLKMWSVSPEFSAIRSLIIVSLAQRMICFSHSTSAASSALAAFYTRNLAEKFPDTKPPLLQLLTTLWQDPSEHVRMAARSLFHCAAPRAIPSQLCNQETILPEYPSSPVHIAFLASVESTTSGDSGVPINDDEDSGINAWLDSFILVDWVSYIEGTSQDAMASHIITAAALVVWYPSIVKVKLAKLIVSPLVKLVMSMNDKYSLTAAELLAEGMDTTWKFCLGPEISHLIGDIFFQIECLSGSSTDSTIKRPAVAVNVSEALIGILLPSLAMADIIGFLSVIEGQIWATSSDSPVHLVSLRTLIRVIRGSPKPLTPNLDKVIKYVLQTMDLGNLVMRKACLSTSIITLKEIARTFPMVALDEASKRLAIGDAVGDLHIRVYDLESVTQIKVLDTNGPPGLPSLLEGSSSSSSKVTTAITALAFSSDGEGLVAFSENGLMIRWWSLGMAWWEKLSRSLVPVQCSKVIFIPPWEGFSPNSSRSSIMASIGHDKQITVEDKANELAEPDNLKLLIRNLDISYRLQWKDGRKVVLTRHGHELASLQL